MNHRRTRHLDTKKRRTGDRFLLSAVLITLFLTDCSCFTLRKVPKDRRSGGTSEAQTGLGVSRNDDEFASRTELTTDELRAEQQSGSLLANALKSNMPLMSLTIRGLTSLKRLGNNNTIACALVSPRDYTDNWMLPVPNCDGLDRLLNSRKERRQPSRLQLLLWNGAIVNRDNGMFDNLPYTEWTAYGPRDAAGQPVSPTYHWGKRQFYNRLMGQDWYKYSRNAVEASSNDDDEVPLYKKDDEILTANNSVLQYRICEIQLRDIQMRIAECESEMAVLKRRLQEDATDTARQELLEQWNGKRLALGEQEEQTRMQLDVLKSKTDLRNPSKRIEDVINEASTVGTDIESADEKMSFDNPFTMFQSLVREMLKAEIVAVFLEDISWTNSSSIALGGGIVLQRKTVTETISLAGEKVQVTNEKETFGSDTVDPGNLYVVDCYADEALQLSVACDIALWCEATLFDGGMMAFNKSNESLYSSLSTWKPSEESTVLAVQGRPVEYNGTVAKVQINFGLLSRWEQAIGGSSSKQVYSTENPIQSLSEYDKLSDDDKVRLLLSLGDNEIKIPRPRAIRSFPQRLDELLLPRVDEVVRTQWRLRELDKTGADIDSVFKSQRFVAKERAQSARDAGEDDIAEWWENEVELYSSLKADITQDEGSYSRFLDKDDWYERDRREAAERARQQFGDLGID